MSRAQAGAAPPSWDDSADAFKATRKWGPFFVFDAAVNELERTFARVKVFTPRTEIRPLLDDLDLSEKISVCDLVHVTWWKSYDLHELAGRSAWSSPCYPVEAVRSA